MSNTLGSIYKITTFGESHGGAVGVVIDGCPPGYKIDLSYVQHFLNRRKPGQSALSSPRKEPDELECLSGLLDNITLGTPITLLVRNQDVKKEHYDQLQNIYRPSHADFTTEKKYGLRASSGGGRASARETIGRVAGAAIAEQVLMQRLPQFKVVAFVETVKDQSASIENPELLTRKEIDEHPLRCPDKMARKKMEQLILSAKQAGDSVGGIIFCGISGCPVGLGEPVFDKFEAELAKAVMSLPASKGFEIGKGFASTKLFGSEHNDSFIVEDGKVKTKTNFSGGVQGGISNGEFIYFRVAFKPVATIFKEQQTVDRSGQEIRFKPDAGRHDPCVLPRAVPMVEAMASLVVMDLYLRQVVIETLRGSYY